MQPNKVLSKAMQVRPLQKGEFVIYRLIEADKVSPNAVDKNGRPVNNNPSWQSAKQTLVRDIETGEKVMIGNVVNVKPEKNFDGTTRYVDVTAPMKFTDANLRVDDQTFATYQFAERHDANMDNPFRDQSKPAKYYRVDVKKRALSENNKNAILADALSWINTCDHIEIKAINKSLPDGFKLNLDSDFEIIKSELFKLTMKDPIMVMKASNNRQAIAKIICMEAEYFHIILWEEKERKWFFNDEKMEDLATIEIGKNRIDGLVEFLKTENGKKFYLRLSNRLKKYLNQGAPN